MNNLLAIAVLKVIAAKYGKTLEKNEGTYTLAFTRENITYSLAIIPENNYMCFGVYPYYTMEKEFKGSCEIVLPKFIEILPMP